MTKLAGSEEDQLGPKSRLFRKFGSDLILASCVVLGLYLIGEGVGTMIVAAITIVVLGRLLGLTPKTIP